MFVTSNNLVLNFAIFLNAIKVFILAQNECVTSSSGKCDSQFLYEEYSGVLRPDEPISLNDQATMRCTSYTKELGMYVIYSKNNKFEGESMVLTCQRRGSDTYCWQPPSLGPFTCGKVCSIEESSNECSKRQYNNVNMCHQKPSGATFDPSQSTAKGTSQPQPYNSTRVYTCPNNCNKISFVCTDIIGSDGRYWKFQLQSGSPASCTAASSCTSTTTTTTTTTTTVSSTTSTISPRTTSTSPLTTTNAPSSTTTTSNIQTTTHTYFSTSTEHSGSSTTTTYLTSTASTDSTTTKVRKNMSWNSHNRSSHMIKAHGHAQIRTNGDNITIIVVVSACTTLVICAFLWLSRKWRCIKHFQKIDPKVADKPKVIGIDTINPLNNVQTTIEVWNQHHAKKLAKFADAPRHEATPNRNIQAVAIREDKNRRKKLVCDQKQQRLSRRISRIRQLKVSDPVKDNLCTASKRTLTPSSREIEMSNKAVFQNDEAVISEKLTSPKASVVMSKQKRDGIISNRIKLKNSGRQLTTKRKNSLESYEKELILIRQRLEERFELENLDKDDKRRVDLEKTAAIIGPNAWHCTYDATVKKTVFWCHRTKSIRLSAPKGWVKARRASIEKTQLKGVDA